MYNYKFYFIQNNGKIVSMNLVGSVKGKNAIIIDDIVDTAVIYSF